VRYPRGSGPAYEGGGGHLLSLSLPFIAEVITMGTHLEPSLFGRVRLGSQLILILD